MRLMILKYKICRVCKINKSIIEFYKRKDSKDGYGNECIKCTRKRLTMRYREQRKWIIEYKLKKGCLICSYNKCARALHFHHLDDFIKEFHIGHLKTYSDDHIIKEIKKCVVICSNCHMEYMEGLIDINKYL